jgi:phosphopantetheinyl transferase
VSPLAGLDLDEITLDLRGSSGVVDLTAPHAQQPRSLPRVRRHHVDTSIASTALAVHAVAATVPDDTASLVAHWLTAPERAAAERRGTRGRAAHVVGRVAAKQAIRAHLDAAGFAELDPERIQITNDERGCPIVAVRGARVATRNLRVTIAHSGGVAVAAAALHRPATGASGKEAGTSTGIGIGIDVEPIEPRSSRFERLTLTAGEQVLRSVPGDDRDTWLTRLWAAKEAAAKATGRGLEGRPKA